MVSFNIGRDFEKPIAIADKHVSVSHNHATITIDGDTWTLFDNNSTNGTYIEDDGVFRRCNKIRITPDTWIRLGEQGHRGFYFKARRVLKPNDYTEDFAEIYETYQEFEAAKEKIESARKMVRFITIPLLILGWGVSMIPAVSSNPTMVRASFMLPGVLSPFIQEALVSKYNKKIKQLQQKLICPKCRRTLGKDDILNREHSLCHAH